MKINRFETYKERYDRLVKTEDDFFNNMSEEIVLMFKTIWLKPIHIGNHWFYYVNHEGEDVPAYCHQSNYDRFDKKHSNFLPIYDKFDTHKFGWSNKKDVVRIFDLIRDRFINENE